MEPGRNKFDILIIVAFLIGLTGNITALWILHRTAKRRNKKHLFMLRCLASNDLIAQLGMLTISNLTKTEYLPNFWVCVSFVVLRGFGLGSGCVAFVMALERWLALTRPFLYQQLVTYQKLKMFLIGLWLTAVTLSYMPLFGFGLYYDGTQDKGHQCVRFRYAVELKDKIYAYTFFVFGASLCICIVLCNSSVIWELCKIRTQHKVLVRRISRSIIKNRVGCTRYQTPEEVAFAKLMAFVCIIFVVCWAPQVISVPISQMFPSTKETKFAKIADTLLCIYFMLDPFVYVLQNYFEGRLPCCYRKKLERIRTPPPTSSTNLGTPTAVIVQPPLFPTP